MAKVYVAEASKSVTYTFATNTFFPLNTDCREEIKKSEILFLPSSHV
jgi:hypothetical protein